MRKNTTLFLSIFLCGLFSLACQIGGFNNSQVSAAAQESGKPQILPSVQCVLAGHKLNIMLARTNREKAQGLMYYTSLEAASGMLFVYNSPQTMSFWMKNTRIPLDLVFFSENLEITEWIESMQPGFGQLEVSLPHYAANGPAQYALELNAGTIARLGLKVGDRLEIPLTLLYSE